MHAPHPQLTPDPAGPVESLDRPNSPAERLSRSHAQLALWMAAEETQASPTPSASLAAARLAGRALANRHPWALVGAAALLGATLVSAPRRSLLRPLLALALSRAATELGRRALERLLPPSRPGPPPSL